MRVVNNPTLCRPAAQQIPDVVNSPIWNGRADRAAHTDGDKMTVMSSQPRSGPGEWTVEVHETKSGSVPFETFFASLDPYRRAVLDVAIKTILARQGHNVAGTEWGKALREGLYEFRVRRELATICREVGVPAPTDVPGDGQVLLRVFFAVYGARIVLLFGGYDKGADPSGKRQEKEIARARKLLKEHQTLLKANKARQRRP
jgi:hypothetical protein